MTPQHPPTAPERIYHWRDTQMSIARCYGGLSYLGHNYIIAQDEEGQPLVRADVLKHETHERYAAQDAARKAEKQDAADRQKELL